MAAIFSVMYPSAPGGRFDMDYYMSVHMPLVEDVFGPTGLRSWTVVEGVRALGGGEPTFRVMTHLTFDTMADLNASVEGPNAHRAFADIPMYTDITPVKQISETV
ncbi:EthD family reductase [Roseiterribacter gracilis]|uniref:EthD domain-containing protein n=1 Tax=Roseiterribacter gracilis TaxID=2812848 RepID=A0A8S8XGR7_9PROT|nr:hypothetical protein TMPK1_25670 [Rhodospirillales bacterium TMPK1]